MYTYVENKPNGFATQIADNFSYGGKPGAVGDYEFVVGKTTAKFIKYNGSDTVLVIPDTCDGKPVTGIRSGALDNLRNVTGITVPATVTGFDGDLFKNCTSLESSIMKVPRLLRMRCSQILSTAAPQTARICTSARR